MHLLNQTSKFELTADDIRVEKISRFHFKFDSRSFNYSMPKDGNSQVIGEINSI